MFSLIYYYIFILIDMFAVAVSYLLDYIFHDFSIFCCTMCYMIDIHIIANHSINTDILIANKHSIILALKFYIWYIRTG